MSETPTLAPQATVRRLRRMVGDTDPGAQEWSDTDLQDILLSTSYAGDSGPEWDLAEAAWTLLTEHLGTLRMRYTFETDSKTFERSDQFKQTSQLIGQYSGQRRVRSVGASRGDVA